MFECWCPAKGTAYSPEPPGTKRALRLTSSRLLSDYSLVKEHAKRIGGKPPRSARETPATALADALVRISPPTVIASPRWGLAVPRRRVANNIALAAPV